MNHTKAVSRVATKNCHESKHLHDTAAPGNASEIVQKTLLPAGIGILQRTPCTGGMTDSMFGTVAPVMHHAPACQSRDDRGCFGCPMRFVFSG